MQPARRTIPRPIMVSRESRMTTAKSDLEGRSAEALEKIATELGGIKSQLLSLNHNLAAVTRQLAAKR